MNKRELLGKAIARILHRYCNFGWSSYYIPGDKFPALIDELLELTSPAEQADHAEIVHFLLRTQHLASAQERAARLQEDYAIYRRR